MRRVHSTTRSRSVYVIKIKDTTDEVNNQTLSKVQGCKVYLGSRGGNRVLVGIESALVFTTMAKAKEYAKSAKYIQVALTNKLAKLRSCGTMINGLFRFDISDLIEIRECRATECSPHRVASSYIVEVDLDNRLDRVAIRSILEGEFFIKVSKDSGKSTTTFESATIFSSRSEASKVCKSSKNVNPGASKARRINYYRGHDQNSKYWNAPGLKLVPLEIIEVM